MNHSTIEFLEYCKNSLKIFYNKYRNDDPFAERISDLEFRECRRIFKGISDNKKEDLPFSIENSRTVEEFLNQITGEHAYNQDVSIEDVIVQIFNSYINYLEDNLFEVQIVKVVCDIPKSISHEKLALDFQRCEKRLNDGDYSGVITLSKSTVEWVCLEILSMFGVEDLGSVKFPTLFKLVREKLNLDANDNRLDVKLKEVINGLNSVVHGLNEIRNISGDGHPTKLKPSYHHALLALNGAKTISSFLFHTYEYQKRKGLINV